MRTVFALVLSLAVLACSKTDEKPATPPPARQEQPIAAPPAPAPPAPPPPAAKQETWAPPLSPDELAALDRYVGFSADGLAFAFAQFSDGAGLNIISFQSATTNTIEKSVPLATAAARAQVASELAEDGFPKPGTAPRIPAAVGVRVVDGKVAVTFSGMPAGRPFDPFADVPGAKIGTAEVAAVSNDGRRAAIRCVSEKPITEFGPARLYRVVNLFE